MSISPEQWNDADLDRDLWPPADVEDMPVGLAWRVVDLLDRLGVAHYAAESTGARLRLWRRGRYTLERLHRVRPTHVACPRWVNAMLLADRSDPERILTEENVAAGEAVARMTPDGVDYVVALRAMLTGVSP